MDIDFFARGVEFFAATWVLIACVWRVSLMKWGRHQCLQIAAYMVLAGWALAHVLGLPDLDVAGVLGTAMLFFSGRHRWLVSAPADVSRLSAKGRELLGGLRSSVVMPDPNRDRVEQQLREFDR